MSLFHCLGRTKGSFQARGKCKHFLTRPVFMARNYYLPAQPLKLEDHTLSAVSACLFNIFTVTLHI
jgi:hypothetical protein